MDKINKNYLSCSGSDDRTILVIPLLRYGIFCECQDRKTIQYPQQLLRSRIGQRCMRIDIDLCITGEPAGIPDGYAAISQAPANSCASQPAGCIHDAVVLMAPIPVIRGLPA